MFWNSGMFLLPCTLLTEEMRQHAPQISAACASGEMQDCPARSLDYALMEHTDKAAMVVWPGRWSDAGSWEELWHLADQDVRGNACLGDALLIDAQECYVRVEGGPPVSLCGAEHLVVVSTADGILIADKRRPELLRKITPQ
jgi:mannose-1-phosphate guanylyltransferase